MNLQKQMWLVLLYSLKELSGGAQRGTVLQYINDHGYWFKNDENDVPPPTRKEKAWRNNFSYERAHLVKYGYMEPGGTGIWEITPAGEAYLYSQIKKIMDAGLPKNACFTLPFLQEIFAEQIPAEDAEDRQLIIQLNRQANSNSAVSANVLSDLPQPKKTASRQVEGRVIYPRDTAVATRALDRAFHLCEIDPTHPSFVRRNGSTLYMEPHHLIPMSMTDYFEVNLDREQNIFSLCSNCHNQIHYGTKEDVGRLVSKLFLSREHEICSILGQIINLEDLYRIYKVL